MVQRDGSCITADGEGEFCLRPEALGVALCGGVGPSWALVGGWQCIREGSWGESWWGPCGVWSWEFLGMGKEI